MALYLCYDTTREDCFQSAFQYTKFFRPWSALRQEYGVLFNHTGQLHKGIQCFYLVINIPLLKPEEIPLEIFYVKWEIDHLQTSE